MLVCDQLVLEKYARPDNPALISCYEPCLMLGMLWLGPIQS